MGTFLEVCGLGLVVSFVWVVCGWEWGILALGAVLVLVGEAIDRGDVHGATAQSDESEQQQP